MIAGWTGAEPRYVREWGGGTWCLALDSSRPGLRPLDGSPGLILGLDAISAAGRSVSNAFDGASLIDHECRFNRVEATYAPPGWGALRLRATWSPRADETIDLEVQVQASSVDELEGVEIHVASELSATFERLDSSGFLSLAQDGDRPACYLEMIHPEDVSREGSHGSVRVESPRPGRVEHRLFGYDLEKGVVLRGRLRGSWLTSRPTPGEAARLWQAFLDEPPPLGS